MCKKYISVFEYSEHHDGYSIMQVNSWNHNNNRPEINIIFGTMDNFRVHTTQECRTGGRVCQICESFKEEWIEMPFCHHSCECIEPEDLVNIREDPEEYTLAEHGYTNRTYLDKIKTYLDLKRKHACVKIINAVREEYPDRHVIIFDARVVIGNETNRSDHLNVGLWIFKKASMLGFDERNRGRSCMQMLGRSSIFGCLQAIGRYFAERRSHRFKSGAI